MTRIMRGSLASVSVVVRITIDIREMLSSGALTTAARLLQVHQTELTDQHAVSLVSDDDAV
jgi:hypothetical protein